MTEERRVSAVMVATTARYQTRNSIYVGTGNTLQMVLPADQRRMYVLFASPIAGGAMPDVYPEPAPPGLTNNTVANQRFEWKWKDCPSIPTGAFYAIVQALSSVRITECLYVGDV